jgi:pimeloyl-ACP methyl ester carboxylesterase
MSSPVTPSGAPPLVLLHGVTNASTVWRHVVPLLTDDFDVCTPTALGHRGGAPHTSTGPASLALLLDDLERQLDQAGWGQVHVAGNSMGGWMALELARRGRALTVCALSPAGMWSTAGRPETNNRLRGALRLARLSRPVAPVVLRSGLVRRRAMRLNAEHGDRLSRRDLLDVIDASLACTITEDMLRTQESFAALDPVPCPVLVAWSGADRVLPLVDNGRIARERLPGAEFVVLDDVGHVPMFDDPALVAATIRRAVALADA